MQPRKILYLLIVIGIAIATVVMFRDNEDQEDVVSKLEKRKPKTEVVTSQDTGMIRLPAGLLAEYDEGTELWYVKQGMSTLEAPFRPDTGPARTDPKPYQSNNPGFVGADACALCHQERHSGFVHTAHHKTSASLSPAVFNGPTGADSVIKTSDPALTYRIEQQDQEYFQLTNFHGWEFEVPMDVVTGSAKLGQTHLYWHGDDLFQVHASYTAPTNEWIPSPGFKDVHLNFGRVVRAQCLECHVTFVQVKQRPNTFHRESAIWGISCERCHGPGQQHIDFHDQNPDATKTKFIHNPKDLSREQQLDICSQCHAGMFKLKKPAFTFRPGDAISDFHTQYEMHDKVGSVHTSNQLERLKKSPCFQMTEMTCTTCHNPHRNERGDAKLFSQACLKCHEVQHCGVAAEIGDKIADDCVSCHMPLTKDMEMPLLTREGLQFPAMVDHHIRIDPTRRTMDAK